MYRQLIIFSAVLLLLVPGCSPQAELPITGSGDVPELFSSFPDSSYLLVMYADVATVLDSEVGTYILAQALGDEELAGMQKAQISNMFSAAGLAVTFHPRNYMDAFKAYDWQLTIEAGENLPLIEGVIQGVARNVFMQKDRQIYEIASLFGNDLPRPVFALLHDSVLIIAGKRSQMADIIDTLNGQALSAAAGERAQEGFTISDKTAPLWWFSLQDSATQGLIGGGWVPEYETMTGRIVTKAGLDGALQLKFEKENQAHATIATWNMLINRKDEMMGASGGESIAAILQLLEEAISVSQAGKHALFEVSMGKEQIAEMISLWQPENPEEQRTEKQTQENEEQSDAADDQ